MAAVNTRTRRTATPAAPQGASPATTALVTTALAATRAVVGTHKDGPALPLQRPALMAFDGELFNEVRSRLNAPSDRDGRRAPPRRLGWSGVAVAAGLAFDAWAARIAADACADASVDWRSLRLDPRDGALFRAGGPGLPVTAHALGQLVGVLGGGWVGARSTVADAPAVVAAPALASIVARSARGVADPLTVRTAMWNGERVARAVVTPRHALTLLDDLTLLSVLRAEVPAHAEVAVARSALGCETRGWARQRFDGSTDLVTHWRNSETGEGRLSMRGGIRIRALDAHVATPHGTTARMVEVSSATSASERNHTLPTLGTEALAVAHPAARITVGVLLTEAQRRIIAQDRMADSYEQATADASKLAAAWALAQTAWPKGWQAPAGKVGLEATAEVLLDLMEEQGLSPENAADKAALQRVLLSDERLQELPRFSAAHVAAAYAVLASSQVVEAEKDERTGKVSEKRSERSWEDAARLQACAGRWVLAGWDSKAHRKLAGEE